MVGKYFPEMILLRHMRLYIGYKYTKVQDKEALVKDLLNFAEELEKAGYCTFLLGRDVQGWKGSLPLWKTLPAILGNMLKSHAFVAYISSDVSSRGLDVELALSKVLGKNRAVLIKNGISHDAQPSLAEGIVFNDNNDAVQKVIKKLGSFRDPISK